MMMGELHFIVGKGWLVSSVREKVLEDSSSSP